MSRRDWTIHLKPKFEMFYLNNPSDAEKPWEHPEPDAVVVEEFVAEDFNGAIEHAKAYCESHTDRTYYWRNQKNKFSYGLLHEDGICTYGASDVDNFFVDRIVKLRKAYREIQNELLECEKSNTKGSLHAWRLRGEKLKLLTKIARIRKLSTNKPLRALVKVIYAIMDWCGWYLKDKWVMKFKDIKWNRRKLSEFKKTGHSPDEWWSLEMHMLNDLKWNLKKLNEHGYAINTKFMYDALHDKYPLESDEKIEKRMNEIMMNSNREEAEEIERLAGENQHQTYDHICHLVDKYTFYLNSEIDDKEVNLAECPDDMKEIYLPYSYNVIDWQAMYKEAQSAWDEIWDLVKKYGQMMGE